MKGPNRGGGVRAGVLAATSRNLIKLLSLTSCLGLVGAFLLTLATPLAFAQTAARVNGFVRDQSGAVIPGARVVLRDEASGTELRGVTDGSGFYGFDPVPPKVYTLTVQMQGFKTYAKSGIEIRTADRLDLSVALELGQQVERVEVTAAAENLVTTDSGAKTDVIGAREIQNLSIIGRNSIELLSLLPGVVNTGFNPGAFGSNFFFNGINQFNVNGQRGDQNDIRLDNAHMLEFGSNNVSIIEPNVDMVQEFSVKTSNFEADQGRSSMIIDAVTKSGGNALHGEGYWYTRNHRFNANDFSNNLAGIPKPQNKFNYLGFNIGGPVRFPGTDFNKKNDKMFFFFHTEWQRQQPDLGTELATVPTAKMRQGDFTELLQSCQSGRALNMPCQLRDPNNWGAPIASNILPSNLITKNGQAFLNLFPLPNFVDPNGRYNFAGHPIRPSNRGQQAVKVDYNLNENTRLYVRLAHETETQIYDYGLWSTPNSGWTSNIPEPTPTVGQNHSQALALNLVKVINPTLTNEFQFNTQAIWLPHKYQDPSKLSKKGLGLNFNGLSFSGQPVVNDTVPQITDQWDYFGGSPGAGRWGSGNVANTVFANKTEFEWIDNLSKVRGAHTMKFGLYASRGRNDQNQGGLLEGMYITDTSWTQSTGNEFGDILTEHFAAFQQSTADPDTLFRFTNIEWYAQDSWKATRRLTLNYGARFAWLQPWNEVRGLMTTFDTKTYVSGKSITDLPGILLASKGQIPNTLSLGTGINVLPRFGLAYDVFGSGKTVIRGGFGFFMQRDQLNTADRPAYSPPNVYTSAPNAPGGVGFMTFGDTEKTDPFGALGNVSLAPFNRFDTSQPQTYEWSLTLSQSIGVKTVLETSYVGNGSRHLYTKRDINAPPLGSMWKPGTQVLADTNANGFRPFKPWADINQADHSTTANYHSLQVIARRNVSQGLTFLTSYTWSKTLGFSPTFNDNVSPFNTQWNYGLLPYDRAHLLNLSYIYQIPGLGKKQFNGNKVAVGAFDGWQLSGITHFVSGSPLKIANGGISCLPSSSALCSQGVFTGDGRTWYGTENHDLGVNPLILTNPQSGVSFSGVGSHWLNVNSPSIPNINKFGTFEQPTIRGPGSQNWDFTLFKRFPWGEKRDIEFRWAMFDMFNHAKLNNPQLSAKFNWNLPVGATSLSQGTASLANAGEFGRITNANGHREMEFALKIHF